MDSKYSSHGLKLPLVFVQRSRREHWTTLFKMCVCVCLSVCLCVTYFQATDWSKVGMLYRGGGH